MMGYGIGTCTGAFLYWAILLGLFLLAVYAVVKLVKRKRVSGNNETGDRQNQSDQALAELKIRFAKGELSKEEFIERKQFLQD